MEQSPAPQISFIMQDHADTTAPRGRYPTRVRRCAAARSFYGVLGNERSSSWGLRLRSSFSFCSSSCSSD